MSTARSLSVFLSADMARMVEDKVASGEYASESDVLRDGLRLMEVHDKITEGWLREQVVPAYDAYLADPDNVRTFEDALDGIEARYKVRNARVG